MDIIPVNNKEGVGNSLISRKGQWSFSTAASNFVEHVQSSIPSYTLGHNIIVELATNFLDENGLVYEVGCSTGELCGKFVNYHTGKKLRYVGIDNVNEMIEIAKRDFKDNSDVEFVVSDACTYDYEMANLFISYYTLQFINPSKRKQLMKKVYNSLMDGGATIIFEKILAEDSYYQDIVTQLYFCFKVNNGYTKNEILNKLFSLQGVLKPQTSSENINMLKDAGYSRVYNIYRCLCFEGYLAIKG